VALEAQIVIHSPRPELRLLAGDLDASRIVQDRDAWDAELLRRGGNLLQSWQWGEFRAMHGWQVERLAGSSAAGSWMAQVLFKRSGPVSVGFIPRGPSMKGDHELIVPRMLNEFDRVAAEYRATTLIIDPNHPWELPGTFKEHGFVKWMKPLTPQANWHALALPDDDLLAGMQARKRSRVRQAIREGCVIERPAMNDETIDRFYAVYADMCRRKSLTELTRDYVANMLTALKDRSEIWFVVGDGAIKAAALMLWFGNEVTYQIGATSTADRGQAAGTYLFYEALRSFRDRGFTHLDLGNIGPRGLRDFKTCFKGTEAIFPPSMERRYNPITSFLTRRLIEHRY
jgi:lipid II:glycine glycyltransferase (peptidoglycan interpeptide bridge formation enzyme)